MKLFWASILLAICVIIHVGGLAFASRLLIRRQAKCGLDLQRTTWLLICVAWWLIWLHLLEIAVWAVFYRWQNCLPDLETAFYFSGTTYTTVGYGDVVLPQSWRLLGALEGLTGILMCGLSTAFFFTVVLRLARSEAK